MSSSICVSRSSISLRNLATSGPLLAAKYWTVLITALLLPCSLIPSLRMAPVGLYAALATTAGVFVGLLNAYLVSRISGLKGERRRIEQRVKSINARLDPLRTQREWRDKQIDEQIDRREKEQAENDVSDFIDHHVGGEWSPNPDDLTLDEIIDNLADYLECERSDLLSHHIEEIQERQPDIREELRPAGGDKMYGMGPPMNDIPLDSSTRVAIDQNETQWEIYDRTLLDRRTADFASLRTEIESLQEEKDRLSHQYSRANPCELIDGVKSTGWAIILSVGIPLFVYLLHAIEQTITIPFGNLIEPVLVFISWSFGLILSFQYVRTEVTDVEDNFPESSIDEEEQEPNGDAISQTKKEEQESAEEIAT